MKDIEAVEKVQKRATKQVKQLKHFHYSERPTRLNLSTLLYRRHRGDMIEVYEILHKIYDPEVSTGILKLSPVTNTRGHDVEVDVVKLRAQTNASMPASYNSNIQLLILILISNNNSDFRFHEFRL